MEKSNILANGLSRKPAIGDALRDALGQALPRLGDRKPAFGFVFSGPKHDLPGGMRLLAEQFPDTRFIGCTTAGEFTQAGLTHGGLSLTLVASEQCSAWTTYATGVGRYAEGAAEMLLVNFADHEQRSARDGMIFGSLVTLVDGLAGAGESLVAALAARMKDSQRIVGGAAGDEAQFVKTTVAAQGFAGSDAAVGLGLFTTRPLGVGLRHGLRPATPAMKVTQAKGNLLQEIDGRPAFEAYQKHAQSRGVALEPASAGSFLIGNEIGVFLFGQLNEARAPLSVTPEGWLRCAGELRTGQQICILDGEPVAMIAAARAAAAEAREGLRGAKPAGAVVFDCVCRGIILGDQFQGEIDAISQELGGVPVSGFLTYGEVGRYGGAMTGFHNTTAIVVAFPE